MNSLKRILKFLFGFAIAIRMQLRGARVGKGLKARQMPFLKVFPGSTISIGNDCVIHNHTRQNVAGIQHRTVLATTKPNARIEIGRGVGMSGVFIVASDRICIEDDVMLGANVKIYDSDFHPLDFIARMRDDQAQIGCRPVIIRRGAWVGANSMLLKGVEIGEFAVIGACSVVTRSVPRCSVYAGNPAKLIKMLPEPKVQA